MKNITLYLDMDGVICHFEKAYRAMWNEFKFDRERFREAVLVREIFSTLDWMPNGEAFIEGVRQIKKDFDINVEMLTSTGSSRTDMRSAAMTQKSKWLLDHGIEWHPNFVSNKPEKARYARPTSILVDDMPGCTTPFSEAGGLAFLHSDADYTLTLDRLKWSLDELTKDFV
jgi:hypothetical protein